MEDVWKTHTVLVNKKLIKENKHRALKENGEIVKKKRRTDTSKLDSHNETFTHNKININISGLIREGRANKKLTQKELAGKLNVPLKTIAMYENGSIIPENNLMGKIERILDIKIRGNIRK